MPKRPIIIAVGLVLVAASLGGYMLLRSEAALPIVGAVRLTEIRVAPNAITIATHCACDSIRKPMRPASSLA
jgi:hypothetical protein